MNILQRAYRFLFPEYQCPNCGGKLYRRYQTINLDEALGWIGVDILFTIVFLLILSVISKLVGETLGFLILVIAGLIIGLKYSDRSNEHYDCESCDKEYSYPELQKTNDK